MPTHVLSTRELDISRTGQLVDYTTRELVNLRTRQAAVSRMLPAVVLVVLIAWLGYVDI